jgi:hypothetical protein
MDISRNQWFMYGVLIVLIGLEFRMTDSMVLNEKTSQIIAQQLHSQELASAGPIKSAYMSRPPESRRTVKIPRWLGLSLVSVGSVLILHSLAMKKA